MKIKETDNSLSLRHVTCCFNSGAFSLVFSIFESFAILFLVASSTFFFFILAFSVVYLAYLLYFCCVTVLFLGLFSTLSSFGEVF